MVAKKAVAAKPKTKRKSVVQQPAPVAGAAASLTSIVPFLPPSWQTWGYAAAALIGAAAPILAMVQQGGQRSSDA